MWVIVKRLTGEVLGQRFEFAPVEFVETFAGRRYVVENGGTRVPVELGTTGEKLTILIERAEGNLHEADIAGALGEDEFSLGYAKDQGGLVEITVKAPEHTRGIYTPLMIMGGLHKPTVTVEWHEGLNELRRQIAQNPLRQIPQTE